MNKTVSIMLRSTYWGQGKTVTALSYTRPGLEQTRRLLFDMEYRDASYRSPDGLDRPDKLQYSFDFFQEIYNHGSVTQPSLLKLYQQLASGEFNYDVIIFDNVALFQEELFIMMSDRTQALGLAKAMRGVYDRNRLFLDYKFKPTDPGGFYPLLKSIIRELLLICRKNNVDVITTTETKNVWKNYGSRDRENPPKILGQTAKAWDPWFQFADVLLVLSRIKGDRTEGNAVLTTYPTAQLDTFNTKCSIPGLAPEFVFKNWDVFWTMVGNRTIPGQEAFDQIKVEIAVEPEDAPGLQTIAEAKETIIRLAVKHELMSSPTDQAGAIKLKKLGEEHGLDSDNALAEYEQWVQLITGDHSE